MPDALWTTNFSAMDDGLEGAMDADVFCAYIAQALRPTFPKGDIVVIDNISAHKAQEAREMTGASGARLLYMPPYSSDLNPIERCWSKIKSFLQAAKAIASERLNEANTSSRSILLLNSAACVRVTHCGYALR